MGGVDRAREAILHMVKGIVRCSGLSVECGECRNLPNAGVVASVVDLVTIAEGDLIFDGCS